MLPTVKPERTRHIQIPPSERVAQTAVGAEAPQTVRIASETGRAAEAVAKYIAARLAEEKTCKKW